MKKGLTFFAVVSAGAAAVCAILAAVAHMREHR